MSLTVTFSNQPGYSDHLVLEREAPAFTLLPQPLRDDARALAQKRHFAGKGGELMLINHGSEQWAICGLGKPENWRKPDYGEAIARGLVALRKAGATGISLHLPLELPQTAKETARITVEALEMAAYDFSPYHTQRDPSAPCTVELVAGADRAAIEAGMEEGRQVGRGISLARDLINHPASVAHPGYVLETAQSVARESGATIRIIQGDALEREGYGAIYAVGKAAPQAPALAVLEMGAASPDIPTVALVGKGVTFDTGGLDLKSATGMAQMKKDMGGAAIVLGGFQTIEALKLPVHLVAVLCLAENAVDARSYHPGDILRSKQGLTIEVTNTDAEGRLLLADGFALARQYDPHYMIDFATLTGACRIALGPQLMGLFCPHEGLRQALVSSAAATGDNLWPMPLHEGYRKKLESEVADLTNAASDGMAGAVTAALFLKEFAGEVAWAHLDCYAWSDGDNPLFPKGGSGVGVRLVTDLMPRLCENFAHGG